MHYTTTDKYINKSQRQQSMSNKVLKLRKKLVPDTQGTLQSMKKGDVLIVNIKDAKTQNIRTAASRIKNMVFEITEKGLVSETKVTRIK